MRIERSSDEILIRIPASLDSEKLQSILDLIRYGELTSKSSLSQEDVDKLARSVNKSWWTKNRNKYIK